MEELERQAARALGGKRHVRADRGEVAPDVDLPPGSPFSVEAKYRKRLPALLLAGLKQAAGYAPGKTPLLIVKQALAVLDLNDLVKLLFLGGDRDAHTPGDDNH